MKILWVYFLLGILVFSMVLAVDLTSGMSLTMEYQTIHAILATTTMQEYIFAIMFFMLPFIIAINNYLKKQRGAKR
ncbi:MAG: hypothetical protein K6T94_06280 [Paenibacillus sp.]|nr:hypothetical protein [Paenibacillus sp.]